MKLLLMLATSVIFLPACSQTLTPPKPAAAPEIAVSYDLIGSNAPAGQCGCFVLNGGGITGAFPIPHKLSVVGQLSTTHAGNIGAPKYDLTLVTYTFGFRYTPQLHSKRVSVFAQGLIGGSHASGSLVSGSNPGASNSSASLAGSLGGGVDLHWKQFISVRALEVDYQPTTVNNNTTSLQNNYRISAGLVFHLSRH